MAAAMAVAAWAALAEAVEMVAAGRHRCPPHRFRCRRRRPRRRAVDGPDGPDGPLPGCCGLLLPPPLTSPELLSPVTPLLTSPLPLPGSPVS